MLSFARATELLRTSSAVRYSAAGVAVVGGAMGAAVLGSPAHAHVLVASTDLPAGSVLTAADFKDVDVTQPGTQALSATQEDAVLGRQLKIELPAGALLLPADLGTFPPTGYAQVSLLLHPGQFPQDLQNGQRVGIYPMSNTEDATGAAASPAAGNLASSGTAPLTGEVLSVSPMSDSQGGTVVELLVPAAQAQSVATAASAALVGLGAGGM